MPFYAVARGKIPGIYMDWETASLMIKGVSQPKYKKFKLKKDADEYMELNCTKISNSFDININDDTISTDNIITFENLFINHLQKQQTIKSISYENFIPDYYVYTDGSCIDNGKPSAIAGYGIYFGSNDPRNISEKVSSDLKQTNNVGELMAIIKTYDIIKNDLELGKKIEIFSDSIYAIRCASEYGEKMKEKDWTKKKGEIPNKELVQKIYELYGSKIGSNIKFTHIKAHTGLTDIHSIGNDQADKLANNAVSLEALEKIYLNIPFKLKDKVKELGAIYDPEVKKWFIRENFINKEKILALIN